MCLLENLKEIHKNKIRENITMKLRCMIFNGCESRPCRSTEQSSNLPVITPASTPYTTQKNRVEIRDFKRKIAIQNKGNYTNSKIFTCSLAVSHYNHKLSWSHSRRTKSLHFLIIFLYLCKTYLFLLLSRSPHYRRTTAQSTAHPINHHRLGLELKVSRRPTEVPAVFSVRCVAPETWLCLGLQQPLSLSMSASVAPCSLQISPELDARRLFVRFFHRRGLTRSTAFRPDTSPGKSEQITKLHQNKTQN